VNTREHAHEAALHMVVVEDGVFGVLATVDDVCRALAAPCLSPCSLA
jgi:hypothetical protein